MDQARIRCLILEADRDAEIASKNAANLRAQRYRSILSGLMGVEAHADAAHPSNIVQNTLAVTERQAQPVCHPCYILFKSID